MEIIHRNGRLNCVQLIFNSLFLLTSPRRLKHLEDGKMCHQFSPEFPVGFSCFPSEYRFVFDANLIFDVHLTEFHTTFPQTDFALE
jgi:hypothetical protein